MKGITIRNRVQIVLSDVIGPENLSRLYFRWLLKYHLDLRNPKTLNEKIQWLKLYEWPNNDLVIKCTDKLLVRRYVEEKGLDFTINELYGCWDDPSQINWDILPNSFVLKTTHGCGFNILCKDKKAFDHKNACKLLECWLKVQFGKYKVEPHYNKIVPRVICEKYLGDGLIDYKFFCLNGKVSFMYISQGSGTSNEYETFFDSHGHKMPFRRTDFEEYQSASLPKNFNKMIEMSELLAQPFPLVRVDWYEINNKIIFGELTFTPGGGLIKFCPKTYDAYFGRILDIDRLVKGTK